jgi:hypothetical protein
MLRKHPFIAFLEQAGKCTSACVDTVTMYDSDGNIEVHVMLVTSIVLYYSSTIYSLLEREFVGLAQKLCLL